MPHRQKVQCLIEELGQQGVGSYTVAPPLFRLLWALGLEVPPPFFLGFVKLAALMGTSFGALWGVLMWVWLWQGAIPASVAATMTVLAAVFAGIIFGVVMAWYMRRTAERLGIPSSWEDYLET
jgi:Family of unknown function (DUF6404)